MQRLAVLLVLCWMRCAAGQYLTGQSSSFLPEPCLSDPSLAEATVIAGGPLGGSPTIKVKDVVQAPNCFPLSWLLPLVSQITAQTNCRSGAPVVDSLLNESRVDASQAPYPYLQRGALASLRQVAAAADTSVAPMRVTLALTPFLFQYFYFRRGFLRICGEAAEHGYVGTTAWEQGATVTLDNADEWAPLFARFSLWTRSGSSFVYDGADTLDVGRRDVETFQLMSTLFGGDPRKVLSSSDPLVFCSARSAVGSHWGV